MRCDRMVETGITAAQRKAAYHGCGKRRIRIAQAVIRVIH